MKFRIADLALVGLLALGLIARNAWAATYFWAVVSGAWSAASWGGTAPTLSGTGVIDNGDTAIVPAGISGTAGDLEVGITGSGGGLNISGGSVTDSFASLSASAGSLGAATVSSGTWSSSSTMAVGYFGTGSLTITGGAVTDANGYLGDAGGSNGTATITSGTWSSSNAIYVGNSGTGSLTINGGAVQTGGNAYIGEYAPSYGTVTVESGTLSVGGFLYVGYSGTGALTVSGGAVTDPTAYIGYQAGSVGMATVTSGTWSSSTSMYVGFSGTGALTITGGSVSVDGGAGMLMLAEYGGSGTLNLGNGGPAGTLSAAIVTGGAGSAVVNFDQNGLYSFAPSLTGSLSVNAIGTGTTTLLSSSSYTGATRVTAGTLIASGSLTGTVSTSVGAGAILEIDGLLNTSATNTVNGTLQGAGSVGAITAHGGVIAPGLTTADAATATGVLTAKGAVTLSSTTSFNIRLGLSASGTDSDQLLVSSGSVNLAGANLQLTLDMAHMDPPASGVPAFYAIIVGGASLTGPNSNAFGSYDGEAIVNNSFETAGGLEFNILYAANANGTGVGTGQDVVLEETAVPEPETWGLVVSAAGLLVPVGRRRVYARFS